MIESYLRTSLVYSQVLTRLCSYLDTCSWNKLLPIHSQDPEPRKTPGGGKRVQTVVGAARQHRSFPSLHPLPWKEGRCASLLDLCRLTSSLSKAVGSSLVSHGRVLPARLEWQSAYPDTIFSWFLPDLVYSSTLNTACLFCLQAPIRVLLPRGTPARQVLACLQEKTRILLPPWSLL